MDLMARQETDYYLLVLIDLHLLAEVLTCHFLEDRGPSIVIWTASEDSLVILKPDSPTSLSNAEEPLMPVSAWLARSVSTTLLATPRRPFHLFAPFSVGTVPYDYLHIVDHRYVSAPCALSVDSQHTEHSDNWKVMHVSALVGPQLG